MARYLAYQVNSIEFFPVHRPENAKILTNVAIDLVEMKIFGKRLLIEFNHKIQIWDMSDDKEELSLSIKRDFEFQNNLTGMTIHNNFFYYFLNGHLKIVDLQNPSIQRTIPSIPLNWRYLPAFEARIPVFGNLMLFYLHKKILILDVLLKKVVIQVDCFKNDYQVYSREELLTSLVAAIRRHYEPIEPIEAADQLKMNKIACSIS